MQTFKIIYYYILKATEIWEELVLGLLDRFRRKKKGEMNSKPEETVTELEEILRGDDETYEALFNTMFLDPRKLSVSMSDAAKEAKKFEQAKDLSGAKMWYEIAGGLAIHKGDTKKVVEYFSKCQEISPETKYLILKNPEKAVARAQQYYKKYLKN